MRDVYTNTEPDAARHNAQHADRTRDFDRSDDTLGLEPRAASPEFAALCRRLKVEAGLHPCPRCAGVFWTAEKRDQHLAQHDAGETGAGRGRS